jgi:hypothetical protein
LRTGTESAGAVVTGVLAGTGTRTGAGASGTLVAREQATRPRRKRLRAES